MLALEIDGASHIEKCNYDKSRQERIEKMRISFLRFDGFKVSKNINGVIQIIYNWIEEYERTHN